MERRSLVSFLNPEQIAPHLTLLWQKFLEQKENADGCQHYDAFLEHVVTTCTTMLELELFLGLRKTISDFPHLLAEYSEKNTLSAEQVGAGTRKKLWWKCLKCGHEWQADGSHRINGTGCPACRGLVATPKNNIAETNPMLIEEYSSRNDIPMTAFTRGSSKYAWWVCKQCQHEWRAKCSNRSILKRGCPACNGKVPTAKKNLAAVYPVLASEYSEKNAAPANAVIPGGHKKRWWLCKKCGHEWQTSVKSRIEGRGCPACSHHILTDTNNLAAAHPDLALEYSTKNLLPADKVLPVGSKKVWWICRSCGHEWQTDAYTRITQKTGCPACANMVITPSNNLACTHPEIAAEYSKDNSLSPRAVVAGSRKLVLWHCRVCQHEWRTTIVSRTSHGTGCPACAGRVPTKSRNLAVTHPALVEEYSERNIKPATEVLAGTGKKIWWQCRICMHEWQSTGSNRVLGNGCPACANKVVTHDNNLAVLFPHLLQEYADKNPLKPDQVYARSMGRLWWVCRECRHEWQTRVRNRTTLGTGCPKCGQKKTQGARRKNKAIAP